MLKTRFRFIHFEKIEDLFGSESVEDVSWACINNRSGSILGGIDYYPDWRQFVFSAKEDSVFSADCLRDIAQFIGELEAAP